MQAEKIVSRLKLNTRDGLKLCARIEDGRVVFSGGKHGEASIWLDVSSVERIKAHWEGYCEANGSKAFPAVGERVHFLRGMFGMWPGKVESSCATSAVIAYTRRNGSKSKVRVELARVQF